MIQIENAGKSFGAQTVFRDLTWHITHGQRVGLVGPNGAGKATLCRILMGEMEVDSASSSTPKYFKVEGTRTYTYPPASGVAFTNCYHEGVSLSSGTNWLLTSYPGAYLYGSLLQANAWSMDDAQVQKWMAAYDIAMEAIRKDSRRSEWQGGPLQVKISGTVV